MAAANWPLCARGRSTCRRALITLSAHLIGSSAPGGSISVPSKAASGLKSRDYHLYAAADKLPERATRFDAPSILAWFTWYHHVSKPADKPLCAAANKTPRGGLHWPTFCPRVFIKRVPNFATKSHPFSREHFSASQPASQQDMALFHAFAGFEERLNGRRELAVN